MSHDPNTIVVVCPVYNRAHALRQALDSILTQTDPNWVCVLLDDGSTDASPAIEQEYVARDSRFRLQRFEANSGGVAMNEVGMGLACDLVGIWTRLGSDDWFEPSKFKLDRIALSSYDACVGPYRNFPEVHGGELNGPSDPRQYLLLGGFTASWANIAMRTDVLRAVRERHGSFCDPRLRNMEDWIFNVRAARFARFVWRAGSTDGKRMVLGAKTQEEVPFPVVADAHYRIAWDGATENPKTRHYVVSDYKFTEIIMGEDRRKNLLIAAHEPPIVQVVEFS